MGLLIVYITGFLVGAVLFALSYIFSREMEGWDRSGILFIIGLGTVFSGLVVGGFGGMPISLTGAGIVSLSLLLMMAGRSSLARKIILVLAVLIPIFYYSYGYTLEKNEEPISDQQTSSPH